MLLDKTTLQTQLDRLAQDSIALQDAINQRQQEAQQIEQRRGQLNEEILRHQGALGYNKVLSDAARKQLEELAAAAN